MPAKPEVVANESELAKQYHTTPNLMGGLEKQRGYVAAMHLMSPPCWSCGEGVTYYDAVGEDYDPKVYRGADEPYSCPHCKVRMIHVVPLMAMPLPWFWGNPKLYDKKESK